MKIRQSRHRTAKVSHSRWLAYATASAATALAGNHSAEAAIHYSGILDVPFPAHRDTAKTFPLDQPGDFISFQRREVGFYGATDAVSFKGASFVGFRHSTYYKYVSKLHFGQNISARSFTHTNLLVPSGGLLDRFGFATVNSQWADRGIGYVGFRFNNGAGIQYGWARVIMRGHPENAFKVIDYAYADPGEPITAGQISGNEMVPEESNELVPDEGSLGGLALGAIGLLAWRKSRSRSPRYSKQSQEINQ